MIADYPCGRSYETAILETDRSKLAKCVQVAERAIMAHIQELDSDRGGNEEEGAAVRDTLSGLRFLQKEITQSVAEENVGSGFQRYRRIANNSGYSGQEQE